MQEKKYLISDRKNYPITAWASDDQPREKLLRKNPESLSDSELLAILINCGYKEKSAVDLAREVLESCNYDLHELSNRSVHELKKIKGIGEARAVTIAASLELARRRQAAVPRKKKTILCSSDAVNLLQAEYSHFENEKCAVVYLNQANQVKHWMLLSEGGITSTIVDVRIIIKKALELGAVKLILCHNHPSGSLEPSRADKTITSRIKEACSLLDLELLDHIIVSSGGYFSFAEQGLL
ncbi:DNA repair protein RadC [Pseudoflavitalea sp. G-6-1-2]|uniref:RadC family protein n=1 Tax=Pseudoflavitalea sp. G-6-1-2 TaxID=2728841 RepID=UPI00146C8EC9|nr:DNA repair protein RadC [Pseudoflavitalea sp. G-6-1-2]NML22707.1 DNA repair protein RadC [Pseudoflavitalea sp. G-6-1-2]